MKDYNSDPYLEKEEDTRYIVSLNPLNFGEPFCWTAPWGYSFPLWHRDVAERIVPEMNADKTHGGNYKPYKVVTVREYFATYHKSS